MPPPRNDSGSNSSSLRQQRGSPTAARRREELLSAAEWQVSLHSQSEFQTLHPTHYRGTSLIRNTHPHRTTLSP